MNGDKRKFLFVSITGLISDIAWQVAKEGHEVRYCIEDEKERDIADGFVPKVRDWQREVDWADVIVFDDTLGQGEKAQALRAKGNAVIGGTPYTDHSTLKRWKRSSPPKVTSATSISTMRQAQAQAYSRIRNIMIPDMYYRDDIGERWFEDHDKLHTWGYLREV